MRRRAPSPQRTVAVARWQSLPVLFLLVLLEIGPVPIAPLLGVYLVIWRPPWFRNLVDRLYADQARP